MWTTFAQMAETPSYSSSLELTHVSSLRIGDGLLRYRHGYC